MASRMIVLNVIRPCHKKINFRLFRRGQVASLTAANRSTKNACRHFAKKGHVTPSSASCIYQIQARGFPLGDVCEPGTVVVPSHVLNL